jgi:hypothetical protein
MERPARPEPGRRPAIVEAQDAKEFDAMPDPLKLILAAGLLGLGACGGKGDDKAAQEVEQAFENKAEALDRAAENASGAAEERLEDRAENLPPDGRSGRRSGRRCRSRRGGAGERAIRKGPGGRGSLPGRAICATREADAAS